MYKVDEDGTIEMIRGDTVPLDVTIYQDDGEGHMVEYIPQPGDEILFTVKKNTKVEEILIQKSGPHIVILPEDTSDLAYKTYQYDVQLTLANGFVDTIVPPTDFIVHDEVTW